MAIPFRWMRVRSERAGSVLFGRQRASGRKRQVQGNSSCFDVRAMHTALQCHMAIGVQVGASRSDAYTRLRPLQTPVVVAHAVRRLKSESSWSVPLSLQHDSRLLLDSVSRAANVIMSSFINALVNSDDASCGPVNPLSQLAKGLGGQGEGSQIGRVSPPSLGQ